MGSRKILKNLIYSIFFLPILGVWLNIFIVLLILTVLAATPLRLLRKSKSNLGRGNFFERGKGRQPRPHV